MRAPRVKVATPITHDVCVSKTMERMGRVEDIGIDEMYQGEGRGETLKGPVEAAGTRNNAIRGEGGRVMHSAAMARERQNLTPCNSQAKA